MHLYYFAAFNKLYLLNVTISRGNRGVVSLK